MKRITFAGIALLLCAVHVGTLHAQSPTLLRTIDQTVFRPGRIAMQSDRSILVSETHRNRVCLLSPDGQVVQSFLVTRPLAVGLDVQGRVLIGHETRVDAFDGSTVAYSLGRGEGEFGKPSDLAVLPNGNILVTDCPNHLVRTYSSDGTALGTIGSPGSGNGEFRFPTGIAINASLGEIYVADQGNSRIQVFDYSGAFLRSFGQFTYQGANGWIFEGTFTRIQGLATDGLGRVYVADSYQNNVQILSSSGAFLGFLDLDDQGQHLFSLPVDLAVAGDRLCVASLANSKIEIFSLDGLATEPNQTTAGIAESYSLAQNYPNPFNPETHIRFSLPQAGHVRLTILDILGREVIRLVDGSRVAGEYTVTWDGRSASGLSASSGIYFYTLRVTDGSNALAFSRHRKMVLLK